MSAHDEVGFVIEAREYRENSLLVRLVTRGEGYISLVARGVRGERKNKGGVSGLLQSFNLVRVQFSLKDGHTLGNLTSVELESGWAAPRESLETYSLAAWWFEIIRHSSQARQDTSAVFECTLRFLEEQEKEYGFNGRFFYQVSLLCHALGYGLHWKSCSVCGKMDVEFTAFSVKSGLVCSGCERAGNQGLSLRSYEKELISTLGRDDYTSNNSAGLDLLTLVNRYLVYHLETPLQSFEFVQRALR